MKVYHGLEDPKLKFRSRVISVGIFDGVHQGHQKIIGKAVSWAGRRRMPSMVVTFDPHPSKVLGSSKPQHVLMSLAHRLRFFEKMGVQEVLVIRFDSKFSKFSHDWFLEELLLKRLGMKSLCVGYDFRFGRGGRGDVAFLAKQSKKCGFDLAVLGPFKKGGEVISSTRIRRLIENGDLKKASRMLGRPVSIYGHVVAGKRRGRGLGFPTANMDPHHETLPKPGVYAVWGVVGGKPLKGVVHVGARPTFGEKEKTVEAHFFNFSDDIYGKEIELFFVSRLRPIQSFKSPATLALAIQKDISKAKKVLKKAF
jgi:riboflavin kinase/FMN adenylyltransferase